MYTDLAGGGASLVIHNVTSVSPYICRYTHQKYSPKGFRLYIFSPASVFYYISMHTHEKWLNIDIASDTADQSVIQLVYMLCGAGVTCNICIYDSTRHCYFLSSMYKGEAKSVDYFTINSY